MARWGGEVAPMWTEDPEPVGKADGARMRAAFKRRLMAPSAAAH
jgi:hypothetical protein